ncbi:MAG: class I tRNA ligase family protein, partial [Solirubrobacterales bacterium]|nr:class I tRNA ligase family protein [Solirubrobacterales bacterium]
YLLMDGHKMSKSLGNVLDPFEVIDRYGADALRYYVLRDVSFGQDGSVSTADFESRYDSELANDLGNLASRSTSMVLRYRDGAVPQVALDDALAADFAGLVPAVSAHLDRGELTPALEEIWKRVRRLNRYVDEQAPWKLAKEEGREADLDRVLASLVEGVRVVAVLLHPWLPDRMGVLLETLHAPDLRLERAAFGAGGLEQVDKLAPLFPKHEARGETAA